MQIIVFSIYFLKMNLSRKGLGVKLAECEPRGRGSRQDLREDGERGGRPGIGGAETGRASGDRRGRAREWKRKRSPLPVPVGSGANMRELPSPGTFAA